ncbi:MAG: undecaprenyl-phosphate glucose phosphotransferase [Thermoanaerobaculia bacterium]
MIQKRRRTRALLYLACDVAAITAAFFVGWWLRFYSGILPEIIPPTPDPPPFSRYLLLLAFAVVIWPVVFYFHGLYQMWRSRSHVDEVVTTALAVVLSGILLSGVTTWVRLPGVERPDGTREWFTYSRGFLALFTIAALLLVASGRVAMRQRLRRLRRQGRNLKRILIVGAGSLGREVSGKLLSHRELGLDVVGFLDDDPAKESATFDGVPVLGTTLQLRDVVERHRIEQVFITLPLEAHKRINELLQAASREGVDVKLVPDILQYAVLKATVDDFDGTPVINLCEVPLQGWSSMAKRAIDIGLALPAVALLAVFGLPLVWLAIRLEDSGPIFYRQVRMGLDGTPFAMLKLRSMRANAEATSGPVWALRDDPRRTRVGSFLRRWSLDELPQLWNVVKGDMSLVGPRPERPAFVREFKEKIPQYMLRHRVKAGMTGWAQIHGWRGNTSIRKRIQYDLYYIENWSLKLDLKILWLTVRRVRWNAH